MMGLRGRLLASYLLLLAITIGLILITAIFFLNTRPAPEQPTWDDLANLALSINLDDIINEARTGTLLPLPRLSAVTELLGSIAQDQSVRILLVSFPSQTVRYDSAGMMERGETLSGEIRDYPLAVRTTGRIYRPLVDTVAGNFYEAGREWLIFGMRALRSLEGETYYLLFADPRPTQSLQGALSEFGTELFPLLLQAAVVGLLVSVVLALLISRSIARPLQTVAQAAMVVAGGRFNQRIPVKGPREVRAVAEAFNRMADEVQSEQQAQQDFLANVSHDLKTPLTSIQGYSQAIMDGAAPNPVAAAKIIYDESARLNRMVVELTDLARLQAGRLSMHMTALDIGQLTEAVAQRLSIVASEKGVQLNIETSPMPEIAGDGDRLEQVLTNLVSNAINYTPTGGTVTVRTQIANNGVEVSVIDTGIGIAPADLPRIFERFYQVDKARGPRRGTGLGLAIVQEIVQAHGGRLTAGSAGEGQGSTFTVWLPSPNLTTIMRRR